MKHILKFSNTTLGRLISNHSWFYPTPINLSYLWSFGSIAGIILGSQILTGIFLAMHYVANIHNSFADLEHIMRDVVGGYGLRYMHANGASMFFIVIYIHIARGIYYGSYKEPRTKLWSSGVILFVLMMAAGFMGYVLPWGQMSFWGATVITNLFSAVPKIGTDIVNLLWGGFSVDNPTLNRFFSLHFLVPFILAGIAGLHLVLLHEYGSNNPLGITKTNEKIAFFSYFGIKDLYSVLFFFVFFLFFVVKLPNTLGHPDNYIEAQPLVTPTHIVPEWYFLPFYAILRAIPNKLAGVISMFWAIIILIFLPWIDSSPFRSNIFKPFLLYSFITFILTVMTLGWLGQKVVEPPYEGASIIISFFYYLYFILLSLDQSIFFKNKN